MRPEIGPIRAFLYARSAAEAQNAPTARADEQLQRLRMYAQDRSYVVVGEACDAGRSGSSLSRPGLAFLLSQATCTPPTFDVLLATDECRLARDLKLLTALASRLTGAGMQIEFIDAGSVWGDEAAREAEQALIEKILSITGSRHEED